jgi:hypothetical protein
VPAAGFVVDSALIAVDKDEEDLPPALRTMLDNIFDNLK